jgi:hypothetical protein
MSLGVRASGTRAMRQWYPAPTVVAWRHIELICDRHPTADSQVGFLLHLVQMVSLPSPALSHPRQL